MHSDADESTVSAEPPVLEFKSFRPSKMLNQLDGFLKKNIEFVVFSTSKLMTN